MKYSKLVSILSTMALLASCNKDDHAFIPGNGIQANVFSAYGNEAALNSEIDMFRFMLGDSLNNAPGKTTGRREVNWDGAPANLTNNSNFPFDFFNNTDPGGPNGRKRGLVYLNQGPLRLDSSSFADIDPSYANEFVPFSKKKAIIAVNSNTSEIVFKVAGTNTDAFVKGFGIVFLDVDDPNSSSLEFFNGTKSLGVYKAPQQTQGGPFSFLGVYFPNEKITRVKITAGTNALAPGNKDLSDGGVNDLVAYDDFFYNEPQAIIK
jgi:hypothetical protein